MRLDLTAVCVIYIL